MNQKTALKRCVTVCMKGCAGCSQEILMKCSVTRRTYR